VNIYRERLFNFEMTHQQQIRSREEQRELGIACDMTDVEFYRRNFGREVLTEDILNATKEMKTLKECDNVGVAVEEPETRPFAEHNALDHIFRVRQANIHYQTSPDSAPFVMSRDLTMLFLDVDIKARVRHWLNDVLRAIRMDPFDIVTPENKTSRSSSTTKLTRDVLTMWTEREADSFLSFPDYGMLNTPEKPGVHAQGIEHFRFMADPPCRRYSESFNQIRRVDVSGLFGEKAKPPKSVR
jgi:hypothetical protein